MSDSTKSAQAPLDVTISTQGATQAVNTLTAALQNMGGVLANINQALDAHQQKLINVSQNGKKLASTVGSARQIADTMNRGRRLMEQGSAGVTFADDRFVAAQGRQVAKTLRDQIFNNFSDLVAGDLRKNLPKAAAMIRSGEISVADARAAATSKKLLNEENGNLKLAERAGKLLNIVNQTEEKIAKEKADQLQAAKDKAAADKKAARLAEQAAKDAEKEVKRQKAENERRQTAQWKLANMQEQANLSLLSTPYGQSLAQANANRSAIKRGQSGVRQQEIDQFIADNAGRLQGQNRRSYFDPNANYMEQGGFAKLVDQQRNLGLHRQALEQMRLSGTNVEKDLKALQIQAVQIGNAMRGVANATATATGTALGIQQFNAAVKLRGLDLTRANQTANTSVEGLNKQQALLRQPELRSALADTQKALNLARLSGDKKAEEAAKALNDKLIIQRDRLREITGEIKKRQDAEKKSAENFQKLNDYKYRTTSLEGQINAARTKGELDRIARLELNKQLATAKKLEESAKALGNIEAQNRAKKLVDQYNAEKEMINSRRKELTAGSSKAQNLNDRMSAEGQGSSFINRMMFMKDYLLMGGVMGAMSGAYSFIRDFEAALKQTQAIAQGTEQQMQGLRKSIIDVSDSSRFSAIELTEATTILAQAGFSVSEIQKSLSSVATLATATGSTLKDSVDIATSVMGAFKMSAESMPQVVNQITQAMNLSKLDVPKFMLATQYAGNAASDLGVTFREMLSATAAVSNTGIRSGSTMGTGMRQLLADLTTPTDKMKKKLTDLGLTFKDVDVRVNGLTGVMKNLKEAGFSTADAFDSFELRAAAYYVALSNNLSSYDDLYAAMDNNTAAMRAQEIQMNSLAAQSDRMTNQFRIAADILGGELRTTLTATTRLIADMTESFNTAADDGIGGMILKIGVLTAALAATILVVKNVSTILRGMISLIAASNAVTAAGGLMSVFGLPFAAVLGASLVAVTALTLGLKYLKSEQEKLTERFDAADTALKSVQERISGYRSAVSEVTEKMKSLSARSESLTDDQAELAIEFDIVRKKALELGIDLKTKVESSIVTLRESWAELREELNKKISIDMSIQGQSLAAKQFSETQLYLSKRQDISKFGSDESNSADYRKLSSEGKAVAMVGGYVQQRHPSGFMLPNIAVGPKRGAILEELSGKQGISLTLERLIAELSNPDLNPETQKTQKVLVDSLFSKVSEAVRAATERQRNLAIKDPNNAELMNVVDKNIASLTFDFADPENINSLLSYYNNFSAIMDQQAQSTRQLQQEANSQAANKSNLQLAGGIGDLSKLNQIGVSVPEDEKMRRLLILSTKVYEDNKELFEQASAKYGVPATLLAAIATAESGGNPNARSGKGALGLMQFMPATAERFNVDDRTDKAQSIDGAGQYLSWLRKRFKGDWSLAAAGYNAGEGNVDKYGGIPPFRETQDYVKRIAAINLHLSNKTAGSVTTQPFLETPMSPQMQGLTAQIADYHQAISVITESLKLPNLSAEQERTLKANSSELSSRLSQAEEEKAALLNSAKQDAMTQRDLNVLDLELKKLKLEGEITKGKLELAQIKPEDRLEDYSAQVKLLAEKSTSLAQIELERKNLSIAETGSGSASLFISAQQKALNEQQLQNQMVRINEDAQKQISEATQRYNEDQKRKAQARFDLAVKLIKEETEALQKAYERRAKDFQRSQDAMKAEAERDLNTLKSSRARMDLPSNKGVYTSQERTILDRRIAEQEEFLGQEFEKNSLTRSLTENQANLKAQVDGAIKLTADLEMLRLKAESESVNMTKEEQEANLLKVRELEDQMAQTADRIAELRSKGTELSASLELLNNSNPNQTSYGKQLADKYSKQWADKNTRESIYADIETGVDSISSGFSGLTENLMNATGGVEDFFRAFIGRSKEGKEAWREFGMSILKTMMKIMTDRITAQFMDFLLNGSGNKVGGGAQGNGLLGQVLGWGLGLLGGSGGSAAASSAVVTAQPSLGLQAPLIATPFASGGPVTGGLPNRDSVPIMAMAGEYVLPKHTTSFLGDSFLEGLRNKPEATMKTFANASAAMKGGKAVTQSTNVYVVSPDQVPAGMSRDDVIVTIADDINRNGPIKQLIKQVNNRA